MNKQNQFTHITEIDGLRALAVILVVLHHTIPAVFHSGYIGVDIFFVISGFVITKSILSEDILSRSWQSLALFYSRRIRRIFPLTFVVFLTSVFVLSLFRADLSNDLNIGISSLFGIANILLYINEVQYFGEVVSDNIFLHTWSLGIEEQFYLFVPLLLLFLHTFFKKIVLWGIFLISIALFLIIGISDQPKNYYNPAFRAWELMTGVLLYVHVKMLSFRIGSFFRSALKYAAISLLIALSIQDILSTEITIFISVLLAALLLILIASNQEEKLVLSMSFMQWIGLRSFSIYMWHWPIFVVSAIITSNIFILLAFVFLITLIVSDLTYNFIERPFRKSALKSFRSAGFFATAVASSIVIALFFSSSNRLFTGTAVSEARYVADLNQFECPTALDTGDTIQILGNSHAMRFKIAVGPIAEKCGYDVSAPLNVQDAHNRGFLLPSAQEFKKEKIDALFGESSPRVLVLASRNRYLYDQPYLNGNGSKWLSHTKAKEKNGWGSTVYLEELDYLISKAREHQAHVVFVEPVLESDRPLQPVGSACYKQWFQIGDVPSYCNPSFDKSWLDSRFEPGLFDQLRKRAASHDNFHILWAGNILCPGTESCSRQLNGFNLLSDTNHISHNAAFMLTRPLGDLLNDLR